MGLLRVILALSVVIGHVGGDISRFLFVPGAVAVQGFYMISGFYIALVLDQKYNRPGDTPLFYRNRALRIFTAYWPFLAVAAIDGLFTLLTRHKGAFADLADAAPRLGVSGLLYVVVSNIVIFGQDAALFLGLGDQGLYWTRDFNTSDPPVFGFFLIHPAWSLAIELMFYCLAPFILRRSSLFVIALIAASLGLRLYGAGLGYGSGAWTYRFFPFEIALFLSGALSYRLYRHLRRRDLRFLPPLISTLLVAAVLFLPLYGAPEEPFFTPTKLALYAGFAVGLPFLFAWTRNTAWDRWIGELSYPVYLAHTLVAHAIHLDNANLRALAVIAVSLIVSVVVVRYVEAPLERYRQRAVVRAHGAATFSAEV